MSASTGAADAVAPVASAAAAPSPLVHIYTQNLRDAGVRPSAGALPTADRLAAPNVDNVFVACQNQLNLLQPIVPENPTIRLGRQGPYASDFIPLTSVVTPLSSHRHRTEVQNVQARSVDDTTDEYLVGSVDSYGAGAVSRVRVSGRASLDVLSTSFLKPPAAVEDGWHGLALHPARLDECVVASHYGRSLSLYRDDRILQTLYTAAGPTAIQYMSSPYFAEPLLVCTEGNTLSVWDLRLANAVGQADNVSRGAVQRLQDTTGDLFTLDTNAQAGIVATGGVDKQVTVYDGRKWQVSGRWKNVLKYEIMSLKFAAFSPNYLYVTGLDHEVFCGSWANQALNARNLERTAFRGDARWVGVARTSDSATRGGGDNLVGLTSSARFYVLRNAHLQSGPLDATGAVPESSATQLALLQQRKEDLAAERRARVADAIAAAKQDGDAKRVAREGKKRKAEEISTDAAQE